MNANDEDFTPLWKRLLEVMASMGWTEADLRREADIKPQDVYNYKYRNESMDAERALLLQRKTKFFAQWIMYGTGPRKLFELTAEEQRMVEEARDNPSVRDAIYALLGLSGT